jgi:hypothetical protein
MKGGGCPFSLVLSSVPAFWHDLLNFSSQNHQQHCHLEMLIKVDLQHVEILTCPPKWNKEKSSWIEFMVKRGEVPWIDSILIIIVNWVYGEGRRGSVICFGWWCCWRRGKGYGDRGACGAKGWWRRRLVWCVVQWNQEGGEQCPSKVNARIE